MIVFYIFSRKFPAMKKHFIIPFLFIILTACGKTGEVSIIPQPVEIQQGKGSFRLKRGTTITYNNPQVKDVAEMLAMKINMATGFTISAVEGKKGKIQLNINDSQNALNGTEGYSLSVIPKVITISANQPAGLFYGMQTLLQLLPPEIESKSAVKADWLIPAVTVIDYPRFGWRGVMLDVSRNFFSKEEVEKYIDQIARFKFNTFHWHLTDDNGWRIEIKSLPKLTEIGAWRVARSGHFGDRDNPKPGEPATVGGFYTQEDIREIVKYAQQRFITIVPEVDVPGHSMAAIASYPELCCTKNPDIKVNPGTQFSEWYGNGTFRMLVDNTLNPSDEKVYEFLDKVFTEMAQIFPGQYIHTGGDECYKGYWEKDPGCRALMKKLGLKNVEQLQGYFMNRVEKILQSKGKKFIGWDEILEGGISPDATVMSWRGIKGGIEAAKLGHYVVMAPTSFAYLDYQQGEETVEPPLYAGLRLQKCYSFNPVPEGVNAKYILGGQGNLWTEQIPEFRHAEYMTWPRGWALAEDYWTPEEKKNWDDFINRVERQFLRNDISGIKYSKAIFDPVISIKKADGKRMIEMTTEASGLKIYYTVDDQMPDNFSPEYMKPFEIPSGGPVTLRVIAFRDGKPVGHLITLTPEDLKNR
jgi:hexosaminidase